MVASWDGRVSCGKCVLGFRTSFVITSQSPSRQAGLARQDLACSPETVEGSLLIETVLPLHWRSAIQYIATVSMPGRKPNHGLAMVSTLIASGWRRPQPQKLSSLCWPLCLFSAWPTLTQLEVRFSSNSL